MWRARGFGSSWARLGSDSDHKLARKLAVGPRGRLRGRNPGTNWRARLGRASWASYWSVGLGAAGFITKLASRGMAFVAARWGRFAATWASSVRTVGSGRALRLAQRETGCPPNPGISTSAGARLGRTMPRLGSGEFSVVGGRQLVDQPLARESGQIEERSSARRLTGMAPTRGLRHRVRITVVW